MPMERNRRRTGVDHHRGPEVLESGRRSSLLKGLSYDAASRLMAPGEGRLDGPPRRPDELHVDRLLEAVLLGDRFKRGAKGPRVRDLQEALFDVTGQDLTTELGTFGRQTQRVTRRFQRDAGIGVDGIVGPDTVMALHGRVRMGSLGLPLEGGGPLMPQEGTAPVLDTHPDGVGSLNIPLE